MKNWEIYSLTFPTCFCYSILFLLFLIDLAFPYCYECWAACYVVNLRVVLRYQK